MMATPRVRALVETSKSVAEIRVVVQLAPDLVVPWRWDLPYLLWAAWGTERTARWLTDQFHQHDQDLSRLIGAETVCQALRRALEVHRRFFRIAWLASL
ncbi:hypothetical protein LJ737_18035 [Hymenobacter sp. 15J16-1T3B]|uniref:hypothetical protein n=1 Tax=Hymenobacter sp. 15J16-1T3B TaxID=2886941 RepID=UPI001D0F8B1A|nr:hypothetical protein [Hymenobacter sp. 15J16-1T3B]MCC3159146.1 hypothetical protein [Hymenobacter sp. 15J16-1T3B]